MRCLLAVISSLLIAFSAKAAVAGFFGPSNFWECIIDEIPGTKNDPAAKEIFKKCKKRFPVEEDVKKKSPLFGVKTVGECVMEYGKDIASPAGARFLFRACKKLYPEE